MTLTNIGRIPKEVLELLTKVSEALNAQYEQGYCDALGEAAEALHDPTDGPPPPGCQFGDNQEAAEWLLHRRFRKG